MPEFYACRHNPVSPPIDRPGHFGTVILRRLFGKTRLEGGAAFKRTGLGGGVGGDLAVARARGEISVGFGVAYALYLTPNANLSSETLPMKNRRSPRIRRKLATFLAF